MSAHDMETLLGVLGIAGALMSSPFLLWACIRDDRGSDQ